MQYLYPNAVNFVRKITACSAKGTTLCIILLRSLFALDLEMIGAFIFKFLILLRILFCFGVWLEITCCFLSLLCDRVVTAFSTECFGLIFGDILSPCFHTPSPTLSASFPFASFYGCTSATVQ